MKPEMLLDIAKRRGFFWPAFEIYSGCSGFYEYGPLGALLKMRIENLLKEWFVGQEGCMLFEAPVLTTIEPWVASGHMKFFTDMTIECEKCGEPYRADHLLEEKTGKSVDGLALPQLQKDIEKAGIKCPKCAGKLGSVFDYNLMFKTDIGPGKNKISGALRPETAQTTYMAFRRFYDIGRKKLPIGVLQIGKSFRNEISPRKALVRLREFTQAEAQFFMDPGMKNKHPRFGEVRDIEVLCLTKTEQKAAGDGKEKKIKIGQLVKSGLTTEWIAYWLGRAIKLFTAMGIDPTKLRARQQKDEERAFYSNDTWDIEFISEIFGRIELVGIADRTDYDLGRHAQLSGADMSVDIGGKKVVPHVIEVAFGIDRPLLCVMESTIKEEKDRVWFSFPPKMAPYQIAVFPLVKKDGLPEKAKEILESLKEAGFFAIYDEGFIGKLYYRHDETGLPYCITVDYDTVKSKDVTVRDRNDQKQVRVKISDLVETMKKIFEGEIKFEKAGKLVK